MPFRRGLRVVAIAGLVAAAGALASVTQIGFGLEEEVGLDWLFSLRGSRPPPSEAVIVRFDRDSLARLRALPEDPAAWPEPLAGCARRQGGIANLANAMRLDRLPRGVPACLVEELHRRGAAVVAFDILFRRDPGREDGIKAMAAAIQAHGGVVLLDHAVRQLGPTSEAGSKREGVQADWLEGPHPELADAAIATAPFLLPRGTAQIHQFWSTNPALPQPTQMPTRALEVLALPAIERLANVTEEHLRTRPHPAEALDQTTGWFRAQVAAPDGGVSAHELGRLSAADASALRALSRVYRGPNAYYLNFYGPPGTFPSVSMADLLVPEPGLPAPDTDLRGRVVFVGYQELGIPQAVDSFATAFRSPTGVDLGGVEILATAFSNLLHDQTLRALPEWARTGLIALIGFLLTLASCLGTVWRGLALTLAIALAYAGTVIAAFVLANLWLPVVIPLIGLLPLAVGLGQVVHYLGAARWLGVYTPHQVSRRLLQGGDFAATAQMREVTVMLTDIVGFTTMAEQNSPAVVTDFVNRHFTMLNRCVEAEGGTLAQFIGDSVMSFWGAPDPQPDHAARACRAALAIGRALADENRYRAVLGQSPVRMRIGINTGMVTAGNVGAPGRSNYGIVGDTVNATQRIEQLAKTLCPDAPTVAILVSDRTRELAGQGFAFREAGTHELRGRRDLARIHRLDAAVGPPAAAAAPAEAADRVAAGPVISHG